MLVLQVERNRKEGRKEWKSFFYHFSFIFAGRLERSVMHSEVTKIYKENILTYCSVSIIEGLIAECYLL
jgi:hypothetical protein